MSLSKDVINDYMKKTNNKLTQSQIKKYFSLFNYFSENKEILSKQELLSKINETITSNDYILLSIKENIQYFPGEKILFIDFLRLFTYGYYEDIKEALFEPIFNQLYINSLENKNINKLTISSLVKQLKEFNYKIKEEDIRELFQERNINGNNEIDFETFLSSIKTQI